MGRLEVVSDVTLAQLAEEGAQRWPGAWTTGGERTALIVIAQRGHRPQLEMRGQGMPVTAPVHAVFYRPRHEADAIAAAGADPSQATFLLLELAEADRTRWVTAFEEHHGYVAGHVTIGALPEDHEAPLKRSFEDEVWPAWIDPAFADLERLPLALPPRSVVGKAYVTLPTITAAASEAATTPPQASEAADPPTEEADAAGADSTPAADLDSGAPPAGEDDEPPTPEAEATPASMVSDGRPSIAPPLPEAPVAPPEDPTTGAESDPFPAPAPAAPEPTADDADAAEHDPPAAAATEVSLPDADGASTDTFVVQPATPLEDDAEIASSPVIVPEVVELTPVAPITPSAQALIDSANTPPPPAAGAGDPDPEQAAEGTETDAEDRPSESTPSGWPSRDPDATPAPSRPAAPAPAAASAPTPASTQPAVPGAAGEEPSASAYADELFNLASRGLGAAGTQDQHQPRARRARPPVGSLSRGDAAASASPGPPLPSTSPSPTPSPGPSAAPTSTNEDDPTPPLPTASPPLPSSPGGPSSPSTPGTPGSDADAADDDVSGPRAELADTTRRLLARGLDISAVMEHPDLQPVVERAMAAGVEVWDVFLEVSQDGS